MVVGEAAVDRVGEPPFECSTGLLRRLGLGEFFQVVVAAWAGVADLVDRDDMDGGVELAVAASAESVPGLVAAGGVDGCGAVEAGEMVLVGEPGDVAGVADDLRGDDRGHAGDVGQRGAGLGDERAELVGQRLCPGFEGSQADDEVAGELLAGGLGRCDGTDTAQQIGGLAGGQIRSWRRRGSGRAAAGGAGSHRWCAQPTRSSRWSLTRRITLARSSAWTRRRRR